MIRAAFVAALLAFALALPASGHDETPGGPPPHGHFRHEVLEQIPGTTAGVFDGRVPAISLRVDDPATELLIEGEDGEPLARFGRAGVEVNEASPTWALTARGRGAFQPTAPVGASESPVWRTENRTPRLTWLEPRAVPRRDGEDFEWSVPALLAGEPASLRARSVWIPPARPGQRELSAWIPGVVFAAGGIGALAGLAFSRRGRRRRAVG